MSYCIQEKIPIALLHKFDMQKMKSGQKIGNDLLQKITFFLEQEWIAFYRHIFQFCPTDTFRQPLYWLVVIIYIF